MVTPRPSFTNPHALRMMRDRALAALWQRHRLWLLFILIVLTFAGSIFIAGKTAAVEVPDRIVAAIAAVETGTEWRSIGDVRGTYARGDIGEVSPWQLSPDVLRDLRAYDRRNRVHADPVFAESLVRDWLGRLYLATGNWPETVAAYHAGLRGRHRPYAREYAERVLAVASVL